MRKKNFEGVTVYPAYVPKGMRPLVGVWLAYPLTPDERTRLLELNANFAPGHIAVQTDGQKTAVKFVGKLPKDGTPRKVALELADAVKKLTGMSSIERQLPDYHAVSRALAVA